ncbi:lysophospholipid acyltransferase family protein [Pseudoteredinibacter isoporae]
MIHKSFYLFMRLMRGLGVCTFEVDGAEKLDREGLLILANHPTLIDVVFLISMLPRADCVVKSALLKNPFTRGPISAGRYIANDNAEDTIVSAKASLDRGNNLIVFPEGTRTQVGKAMKLQRGAANIAVRTANNITPVIIKCSPSTLTKQESWYNIPPRRFHISISVRDDIEIAPYLESVPSVAARELSKNLTDYFEKEIIRDE